MRLLDIISASEHCLFQVVDIPTRNDKTLDLSFTNAPPPVNRVKRMPPIRRSMSIIARIWPALKTTRPNLRTHTIVTCQCQ